MPYKLSCSCASRYIKTFGGPARCSSCGQEAVLDSPKALQSRLLDYDYDCPITGKPIRSKRAHEDNLIRHGKHVLEHGELEDAKRTRAAIDAKLEDEICETAAQLVHDLPEAAKLQLEKELLGDINLTRGTI